MAGPGIAIVPLAEPGAVQAVEDAGGRIVQPTEADGLVWTNPRDPEALKETLKISPARWVQLPFAGVERFVAAGAIDPERVWTCAKGIYGPACAEHALALMLAGARRLHVHVKEKTWKEPGFGSPERRLAGTTALIVGTGGIGSSLAEMLAPIGTRLLGLNRSGKPVDWAERTVTSEGLLGILPEADFVVVCAALTPETQHMIGKAAFDAMKPDAWLVNVARGGLVRTEDLIDALENGDIGGAGLDVTDPEPLPDGHPLWDAPNVIITPHIANTWDMALPELRALVGRNVAHFARGEPLEGPLDPSLGY